MSSGISKALNQLCAFARIVCNADLAVAIEVEADGRATPVAAAPVHQFTPFNLKHTGLLEQDWSTDPIDAKAFRLPTALIHELDDQASFVFFVPVNPGYARSSGLLLLWTDKKRPSALVADIGLLASSVSAGFTKRREDVQHKRMRDQFNDLFESVPSGIVLFDGQRAMVNARAAELLEVDPGVYPPHQLATPMRQLRWRCANKDHLEQIYAQHLGNIDYAAINHWVIGDKTYEVDTHPIRNAGERGRIWIFNDVTAELKIAAELRSLAQSDPLTGVPNRRAFEERFEQITSAPDNDTRPFALLMLDVDHFKRINDTHGHLVGDEVLIKVAARSREALREKDLFARFGGEEFIALLSVRESEEVVAIAERLRKSISSDPIQAGNKYINVTVSIGVAIGIKGKDSSEDFREMLIKIADKALYSGKKMGRDRVVYATPS